MSSFGSWLALTELARRCTGQSFLNRVVRNVLQSQQP